MHWIFISFALISVVAWLNRFPDGMIFAGGDVIQYFNQDYIERNFHHIWSNVAGEGGFSPVFLYYPYYAVLFAISNTLGLSASDQSVLYMLFLIGGAYLGCLVALSLIKLERASVWSLEASLISLVYAINPFTLYAFYFIWGYSPFLSIYIVAPILIVGALEYFSGDARVMEPRLLAILVLAHLFATISYANVPYFISINLLFLILGLVVWKLGASYGVKRFLSKAAIFFALEMAATAWAVLPQLAFLLSSDMPTAAYEIFDARGWILWQRMSFWALFALSPEASEFLKHYPLLVSLSFIIVAVVIFLGVAVHRLQGSLSAKARWLAAMMAILFIALIETKGKGILPADVTVFLFSNPLMGALRSNGKALIFLPALAVILIILRMRDMTAVSRRRWLVGVFMVSTIAAYPMITGQLQTRASIGLNKGEICETAKYCYLNIIPDEYRAAADAIKNDGLGGKILSIPYSVINSPGWMQYPGWKHIGADPTAQLFSLPVVQMNTYHAFGYPYGLEWENAPEGDAAGLFKFVTSLGVSYLLLHKDVDKQFVFPSKHMHRLDDFAQERLVVKIYDSRMISVYRVSDKLLRPTITAHSISNPANPVVLDVAKVDPTRYVVKLKTTNEGNVSLVLREGFSRLWRVHVLSERMGDAASSEEIEKSLSWWSTFFLPSLPEEWHGRYQEYGNNWNVNMGELCGGGECNKEVVLIVEAEPQKYVTAFKVGGLLFLLVFAGVCFMSMWRQRLHTHAQRDQHRSQPSL